MRLWALTGGVGMGKSTSAGFFAGQGAVILDTDIIARKLVEPGQEALLEIHKAFGSQVFQPNGQLNRNLLAGVVFASAEKRQVLENILHPRIRAQWKSAVQTLASDGANFIIVVIPLLYETRGEHEFQKVICTACTPASQYQRLLTRGWNKKQIEERIAAQDPAPDKMAKSNFVIWSEGTLEVHAEQVREIAARQ